MRIENYNDLPDNYWEVIEEYLPSYSFDDRVLWSDIYTRYLNDEEVWESDLEWLPKDKEVAREQLELIDLELYNEAIEAKTLEDGE